MILVSTYLESKSISHITIIIIVELHIVKLREREEQREGHSKVILKIIDCRLSIFDILSLELTLNLFASPSITTHRKSHFSMFMAGMVQERLVGWDQWKVYWTNMGYVTMLGAGMAVIEDEG